jgi:hypothetical protein
VGLKHVWHLVAGTPRGEESLGFAEAPVCVVFLSWQGEEDAVRTARAAAVAQEAVANAVAGVRLQRAACEAQLQLCGLRARGVDASERAQLAAREARASQDAAAALAKVRRRTLRGSIAALHGCRALHKATSVTALLSAMPH